MSLASGRDCGRAADRFQEKLTAFAREKRVVLSLGAIAAKQRERGHRLCEMMGAIYLENQEIVPIWQQRVVNNVLAIILPESVSFLPQPGGGHEVRGLPVDFYAMEDAAVARRRHFTPVFGCL
ncbi:hypothetical protein [Mesorhizobium sp. M0239]|uniref:hypothetical protein n=1 Tax=unclassified Mesorhizobium TaxID=325217 RepID=UPI00333A5BE6